MNDAQLMADYMREVEGGGTVLQVTVVEWPHPAEPVLRWTGMTQEILESC